MIGGHWAGSQVAWYVQRCFRLKLQKHFSSCYSWRKKACKNAVLTNQWGALTVTAVLFSAPVEFWLFPSHWLLLVLSKPFFHLGVRDD